MGDTENDAIDLEHANGWLAFEMLGQLLDQEEFHPEQMSETTAYRFGVAGTNGNFRVVVHCNVELEQLYDYVLTDVRVPEDRRLAVAELSTRANYGMRIGNFELDLRDGEVRYKSSVDFEHNALTASLAMNALMPALGTMDRYFPAVMGVAFGSIDPAEAIAELEPIVEDRPAEDRVESRLFGNVGGTGGNLMSSPYGGRRENNAGAFVGSSTSRGRVDRSHGWSGSGGRRSRGRCG